MQRTDQTQPQHNMQLLRAPLGQRFEAEAKRAGLLGGAPKKTRGFRGGNAAAAGRRSAEIRAAASAAMAEGSAAGAGGNAASSSGTTSAEEI